MINSYVNFVKGSDGGLGLSFLTAWAKKARFKNT